MDDHLGNVEASGSLPNETDDASLGHNDECDGAVVRFNLDDSRDGRSLRRRICSEVLNPPPVAAPSLEGGVGVPDTSRVALQRRSQAAEAQLGAIHSNNFETLRVERELA